MSVTANHFSSNVARWLVLGSLCTTLVACSQKEPTEAEKKFADQMMVCEYIVVLTLFYTKGEPLKGFPLIQSYSKVAGRVAGPQYIALRIKDHSFTERAHDAMMAHAQSHAGSNKPEDLQGVHVGKALAELISDCNQRAQQPPAAAAH